MRQGNVFPSGIVELRIEEFLSVARYGKPRGGQPRNASGEPLEFPVEVEVVRSRACAISPQQQKSKERMSNGLHDTT